MTTKLYENWLSKIHECGLNNEQACGLAMILAWNLTSQNKDSNTYDPDIYWKFIDKSDFDSISKNAFIIEDFINFVPLLKLAGEVLRTPMPVNRLDGENQVAELLNLDWQNDLKDAGENDKIRNQLFWRHNFDLLWCQKIGESLRSEIRNPIHAFVLVDYLTQGFGKFDPEGYSRILHSISSRKSPFVAIFSSRYFVIERNGLQGYEPFQIALTGFMANLDPKLGEQLWNLQRILFYKQPGGIPFNLDKQFLTLSEFIEFSLPLITDFIDGNRNSFVDTGKLIASEYLYRSSEFQPFDQFFDLLEERYGFSDNLNINEIPTLLIVNAVAFYTTCCLKIRNITNKIFTLPTLRMLDDIGLLWTRELPLNQNLRDEALLCFDVMLSWRSGASWALFIETDNGFFQRAYVGDTSSYSDVENLFSEICIAYSPVKCVVAFWTHRQHGVDAVKEEVVFLNLIKDEIPFVEVFEGLSDDKLGRSLGGYVGLSDDSKITSSYFQKLQNIFNSQFSFEEIKEKQNEIIGLFPPSINWNFVNRLYLLVENNESRTYLDVESAMHDGFKTSLYLLIDYNNVRKNSDDSEFLSSKILCEYDCKNKTRRFVSIKMYELSMCSGSCVHDSGLLSEPASEVPSEGNIGYMAWEIACKLNPYI
jgi:hypothetical protein